MGFELRDDGRQNLIVGGEAIKDIDTLYDKLKEYGNKNRDSLINTLNSDQIGIIANRYFLEYPWDNWYDKANGKYEKDPFDSLDIFLKYFCRNYKESSSKKKKYKLDDIICQSLENLNDVLLGDTVDD